MTLLDQLPESTKQVRGPVRTKRWRALFFGGLALTVSSLFAGMAYAYFTSTGSGSTQGYVGGFALTENGPPATRTCSYPHLVPGDLTGAPASACALSVIFAGTGTAFLSLDVLIETQAGSGGSTLYHANSAGLTFTITDDGGSSFAVPATPTTCPGTAPAGSTCYESDHELAAWYPGSNPGFTNAKSATWTVTPSFPTTVQNPYQDGSAQMTLTAHAVQAEDNPVPGSCTVGHPCPAGGGFTWG
jgi:hypothetical protein